MTSEGESDQNAVIRGILASVAAGELSQLSQSDGSTDSVAQLLAAALAQVGHTLLNQQSTSQAQKITDTAQNIEEETEGEQTDTSVDNFTFNPQEAVSASIAIGEEDSSNVASSVEVLASSKAKPLCIKFPIELRKRIINMRKEGKKCKDIAKELKISISGAQKVWERFLATGRVHDRKASTYAGRPRKYTYSQESEQSPTLDTNYIGESIEVFQTGSHSPTQIEYVTAPDGDLSAEGVETTVIIAGDSSDVITEGPLDIPGATVEIVETDPLPLASHQQRKSPKKEAPAYRQHLLFRLVENCPLAVLQASQSTDATKALHVENLASSVHKPLYMEYVLGHPFGKVPPAKPFEGNTEEAQIIRSDPANPVGKDLLAALGYSNKVYFNACCKPSPLFDSSKVTASLPFSIGPGYLGETMQKVLQLLIDFCQDSISALDLIPAGEGETLIASSVDGEIKTKCFTPPVKLSDYWNSLYDLAAKLQCCENFLSASKPSAPCLMCHPFESLVKQLEIKDPDEDSLSPIETDHLIQPLIASPSISPHTSEQQVEIQVLQSGQVTLSPVSSAPVTSAINNTTSDSATDDSNSSLRRATRKSGRRKELAQVIEDISGGSATEHQVHVQRERCVLEGATSAGKQRVSQTPIVAETRSAVSQTSMEDGGYQVQMQSTAGDSGQSTGQEVECVGDARSPSEHKKASGVDVSTQTLNATLRLERVDRTPLIIRRKRTPRIVSPTNNQQLSQATHVEPCSKSEQLSSKMMQDVEPCLKSEQLSSKMMQESNTPSLMETSCTQESLIQTHAQTSQSDEGSKVKQSTQDDAMDEVTNAGDNNPKREGPPQNESSTLVGEPIINESEAESTQPRLRRSARKTVKSQKAQSTSSSPSNTSPNKRAPSPKKKPLQSSVSSSRGVKRVLGFESNKDDSVVSPPAVKRTRRTRSSKAQFLGGEHLPSGSGGKHPMSWSVEDVVDFVSGIPQCECTDVFREHEVDGESFLALTPEIMVKLMDLKAGPALRVQKKIIELKQQFDIPTSFPIS